jgi:hypothetical protein
MIVKKKKKKKNPYILAMGFDSYTTSSQQLHNTPSHGGGPHTLGPTPCEGVLCSCCGDVVNLSFSFDNLALSMASVTWAGAQGTNTWLECA